MSELWLIDALLESLDSTEQKEIDRAWLEESKDRLKAFQAGDILKCVYTTCSYRCYD